MGFGLACSERLIFARQNGIPANVGLYQAKPPSYLDSPSRMQSGIPMPPITVPRLA